MTEMIYFGIISYTEMTFIGGIVTGIVISGIYWLSRHWNE